MLKLTVFFGAAQPQSWVFLFKDEDRANAVYAHISREMGTPGRRVEVIDDFGTRALFPAPLIQGYMLEELAKSKEAAIELGIHQAHVNAEGNQRAQSDSKLRVAALSGQAPMIIGPGIGRG